MGWYGPLRKRYVRVEGIRRERKIIDYWIS